MGLTIDILLLVAGTIATLAAFGGDTWTKEDKPLAARITRRGWVSLSCLIVALLLGVVDQVQSTSAGQAMDVKLDAAIKERNEVKHELRRANEALDRQQHETNRLLQELASTRIEIQRIPKEVDGTVLTFQREPEISVKSTRTGDPLRVQGGDIIDYYVIDNRRLRENS